MEYYFIGVYFLISPASLRPPVVGVWRGSGGDVGITLVFTRKLFLFLFAPENEVQRILSFPLLVVDISTTETSEFVNFSFFFFEL